MAKELEFSHADVETLEQELHQLTLQAQTVCQTAGDRSESCVAARHAVDQMQVAVSDLRRAEQNRTFFDRHCAAHPDALDCRIYDV